MAGIIFYDIPSRERSCWTPNAWKGKSLVKRREEATVRGRVS